MTPSADLFDLIKALSVSEKRYFKVYAAAMGGKEDRLYLKLFDEIDKMPEYDEGALILNNRKEPFLKNLSSNKNYLFNNILRALLLYGGDKSVALQSLFHIAAIEVLFQKGLFGPCLKTIKRSKEFAIQYENFSAYDSLSDWEARTLARKADFGEVLETIDQQIEYAMKRIEILKYKKLSVAIYNLGMAVENNGAEEDMKKLDAAAQFFLQKKPDISLGISCQYYYYSALGFYYEAKKDQKRRLEYCRKVFELFNQHPHFFAANERMYSSSVNNLCSALLAQGNLVEVQDRINELKEFLARSNNTLKTEWKATTLVKILTTEIVMHSAQKKYNRVSELYNQVMIFLVDYRKYIASEDLWELQFNIAFSLFMDRQYEKALSFIQEILNSSASRTWRKLYEIARIFALIIYFEIKEYTLLANSIESTRKYFSRKGISSPVINQLFIYLKTYDKPDKVKREILALQKIVERDLKENPDSIAQKINLGVWISQKVKESK
jgi:hypothetical protein